MITCNDLYEALRKEKYSEQLQPLPKNFVKEVAIYIKEKEEVSEKQFKEDLFSEDAKKTKKQLENVIALFKELVLRRKKKLLELAFISAETGISKRDFENMLNYERVMFDKITKALSDGEKEMDKLISLQDDGYSEKNKLITFKQDADEFLDLEGNKLGPFKKGDIVNISSEIANILILDNKAEFVNEE